MLKACSRCGKVHKVNECTIPVIKKNRVYSREGRTQEQVFRSSALWQKTRNEILERDNYTCRLCLHNHIINHEHLQVHHIVKIRDNSTLKLEGSNLITLCKACHELVENNNYYNVILSLLADTPPHVSLAIETDTP